MATSTNDPPGTVVVGEWSDADLVRACGDGDGGGAFAALVHRHGRTVYAVCRGLLGDGADADDAFQATFLVFLRRAGQLKQPAAVGGWLGGVAARVAGRLRQQRARAWQRGTALGGANEMAARVPETTGSADPVAVALSAEERGAVWAEVAALPDKYRDVVLLCHLEERTTEDAAAALGCPVGTVRSRLLKARELLRSRLVRRGVAAAITAALLVLTESRAAANPPPELLRKTTAGTGAVPPAVAGLVRDWARGDLARWRWLGVSAGLATLLILAVVKLARGPEAEPSVIPPPAAQLTRAGPGTLLVVSQKDATVTFLDPDTGRSRATVATDPSPQEVAVSPDGRTAAVANYGLPFGPAHGSTVTILDVAAGTKRKTIDVGPGSAPHGLVWLDDRRLLCTTETAEALVEIDATDGKVTRSLQTAQGGTHMVAAAGNLAYTANALSDTVTAFDLNTGAKLRDRAVGKWPEGIAISPDGKRLWVGNRTDNTVSVLAAEDLTVLKVLQAPGTPLRLAYSPDGKTVAVVQIESGELALFDALTMTERKRVALSGGKFVFDAPGPRPPATGVVFSPDSRTAYCAMHFSKAVAVVDVASGTVTGKFTLPGEALVGIAFSPVSPGE